MTHKSSVQVYDPKSKNLIDEEIPLEGMLRFMYQNDTYGATMLRMFISKNSLCSSLIGTWMKMPWTKKGIKPFVKKHGIKEDDFINDYHSFNSFFTRKLKEGARKMEEGIILPCDGRHLFFQDLSKKNSFYVKGQELSLLKLLGDLNLHTIFKTGSMIISRLAPVDYHRFHFPTDGYIRKITPMNGSLFSVNPIALREMVPVLTENKRVLVEMVSEKFGNILQIVVGATNVGSIHLTAKERTDYKKGDEVGYFSFGGSMVITLFQRDAILFKDHLLEQSENQTECLLTLGTSIEKNT